ncbi:putative glucan endo-alpha-glucosidase agn1 protein [Dichotomopilus funicola]|uniref:Glucan endo-alpha-glucosidase agn1 protein n=1 Tax=Dichotomopilus funicola TaxID=1934379 RepID=A0AAN6ZJS3_9PEZI|nr:putative glucan endo-alpha-glucosidase agn1 protein [Dichotomopilus funicola]
MGADVLLIWLLACLLSAFHALANAQAVFAHFMVGNTAMYSVADWEDDMADASASHIDGFVLNMARGETTNGASLANAFTAVSNLGNDFKLFFSFDYAGNGLWDKADVIALVNTYAPHAAYYKRGSQPLVSTFEGPAASADWPDIKSSLGAGPTWAKGTADGLLSWAAWPEGAKSMITFTDNSYRDVLGSAPYMMLVSPWFYTNMPGFRKNWLWRGDELWFDRWVHPPHHIRPLRSNAYNAFDAAHGRTPLNYALNKPHDGWRAFVPFLIDMAKTNTTSFDQENVVAWYREQPASACGTGGTTGNTASALAQDRLFYAALLGSPATVSVSIGGQVVAGNPITTSCPGGITNWNANVIIGRNYGYCPASLCQIYPADHTCTAPNPTAPPVPVCVSGMTDGPFSDLCSFSCHHGFCPPEICTCTRAGLFGPLAPALTKLLLPEAGRAQGMPLVGLRNKLQGG